MTSMLPSAARILIVDDLAENRLALEALLRQDERIVHEAASGDEALALLLDHEFALAILDVQMPAMNGFELAALMRGTEKTRGIPIIFVTAAGRELDYSFQGYDAGAVDVLYKPLDADAVRSKVRVFVDLYRQRKEIQHQLLALEASRKEQEALGRRLGAAHAELERAVLLRDEFMSMVAHELRTPLNTLYINAQSRKLQAERDNAAFFTIERNKNLAERDVRQARTMIRLIDDMLDVSRIQSGRLSIEAAVVDLAAVVHRVVDDMAQPIESSGSEVIVVDPGEPIRGCWDAFRLEQIVVNLLGNALRYGGGKPVRIGLAQIGGSARVSVADGGPGIAVADQQRIFAKFERAEGSNAARGLGLGLFITRQLVEAHGGRIEVESRPGHGATFVVTLPLEPTRPIG